MPEDDLQQKKDTNPYDLSTKKEEVPSQNKIDSIEQLLKEDVHYSKKQDDLLDIHVGNPLRKITKLLEEIKKQKAFSFTLKGSLGIAGVALVVGMFGIFGGSKMLCDKGTQSRFGTIRVLRYKEVANPTLLESIPLLGFVFSSQKTSKIILINPVSQPVNIIPKNYSNATIYGNKEVVITGNFDACSNSLTFSDQNGLEMN